MNNNTKNIIIGVLALIVIGGGGYYLVKNNSITEVPAVPEAEAPLATTINSKTSSTVAPTPVPTLKPDAPIVATGQKNDVSSSTANVTGQVNPNGAITLYWFEYGETTALGNRTTFQQLGSGYTLTSTPGYITGLKSNTVYYYRLSAKNKFATVNGSTYSFQTNNTPPVKTAAPTVSTNGSTDITRTTATLNGKVDPNGRQTDFWFEYGKDNDLGYVTAFRSADNGDSSINVSMSVSNLDPLTKYYFRINAQNQYGTVNGAIQSFTTKGPPDPAKPSVTTTAASNVGSTSATLNGRIDPNEAETTYWFEYSEDSLLGTLIGSGTAEQSLGADKGSTSVKANISNLKKSTTYYYRLIGRNSQGIVEGKIVSFKTRS